MPTAAPKNFGKVSPLPGDPGKRRMLAGKRGILTGNKKEMLSTEGIQRCFLGGDPGRRKRTAMIGKKSMISARRRRRNG